MSDMQSKVDALRELIKFRKSGSFSLSIKDKLEEEILQLAEQIRRLPITLTMDHK